MTVRLTLKLLGAGNGEEGVTVTDSQTEQQKQRWTDVCGQHRLFYLRNISCEPLDRNVLITGKRHGPHVSDAGRVGGAKMEKQVKTTSRARAAPSS